MRVDTNRLINWTGMTAESFEPDPVIEAYKKDVDRTLLRQNLRRSVAERLANLLALQRLAEEAREAGRRFRSGSPFATTGSALRPHGGGPNPRQQTLEIALAPFEQAN